MLSIEGTHPNLKRLSHSSRDLLHSCPRKYYLYKMLTNRIIRGVLEAEDSEHLRYGDVTGFGIQQYFLHKDLDQCYWEMFKRWPGGLDDESEKKKTFWHSLNAVDKFVPFYLDNYQHTELLHFDGIPAIELGFSIDCGDGYVYRGFLDALLIDRMNRKLIVYEGKTTGSYVTHSAMFQNSGQALGYKLVIDALVKKLGWKFQEDYSVSYCIYQTKKQEWSIMGPFMKTHVELALWVKNILMDCQLVDFYNGQDYWPQHGENCYNFGSVCQYFDICHMSDKYLLGVEDTSLIVPKPEDEKKYQFKFKLEDLLETLS